MPSRFVRRLRTAPFLLLAAAGLVFGFKATPASAQSGAVPAEVLIVLGKEEAGDIDPALQSMSALRRAPFDAFRSMEVLSRPRVRLRVNTPQQVRLPNGRTVQLILQQVLPNGRYRVRVSINRPDQSDYLPLLTVVASPGDPFFVAGQSHQGGTLIIGVRIGEEAAGSPKPLGAERPTRLLRR